jgi:hypothetical protein
MSTADTSKEMDTIEPEGLAVPSAKEVIGESEDPEKLSTEMVIAPIDLTVPNKEDMSAEMVIASKDSAKPKEDPSKLVRQRSITDPHKEHYLVTPAYLILNSHGACPVEVGCVGPDSATTNLPIIKKKFPIPPGLRVTIFSSVPLSGLVSMNTPEIVKKISDLFFEFATDPANTTLTPQQYEVKMNIFQTKIQKLLLSEVCDDIIEQIKKNAVIIRKTNRGPKRENAIESVRDLVNYADLLLKNPHIIAFGKIYDGNSSEHNMIDQKNLTRGQIEFDAIKLEEANNPKEASTNWTNIWFQGVPFLTNRKPHPDGFNPKRNPDGTINHEKKNMWNREKVERSNTLEELIYGLHALGYKEIGIYDNTCHTLINNITGLELISASLLSRLQEAEMEAIKKQQEITTEYLRISSESQEDPLLEALRTEKTALEKEREEILETKIGLLKVIEEIKEGLIDFCKKKSRGNPDEIFPLGGKKTRRIGLKMTVKKSIRSTMKKTRNKKIKRLKKGMKGRKTKKRFLKNKK